ncbi:MAG: hypothetical protein QXX68_03470 [Candidatus Pacearchaeota archaeon]
MSKLRKLLVDLGELEDNPEKIKIRAILSTFGKFLFAGLILLVFYFVSSWVVYENDKRMCRIWYETQDSFFQFQLDICEKFGITKEKASDFEEYILLKNIEKKVLDSAPKL